MRAPVLGGAEKAAAGHGRDADRRDQMPHERDVVGVAEVIDVRHDVVRTARVVAHEARAAKNAEQALANLRQTQARLGVRDGETFQIKDFSQVKNVTAQLELAEKELRRAERLVETGDISRAIYDQRKSQRDALIGQLDEARRLADGPRRDFPSHTLVQRVGLPVIDGAVALASNDAAGAVAALEPAVRYELTNVQFFEPLYPAYLRGLALLRAGAADRAAAEFQKILDRPALMSRTVLMPLAMLQTARAQRAMGADASALGSYEAFLAGWKDADADIPLYAEAKAEHRELRDRLGSSSLNAR